MYKKNFEFDIDLNGCFNVTSHAEDKNGYTRIKRNWKTIKSHRLIYEECFGEIPDGLLVRHKCDNPSCINPLHLELGTNKENAEDRERNNTNYRGSKSAMSKLTEDDVKEIKRLFGVMKQTEIAKRFGVFKTTINKIKKNQTWKHV